MRMPRKLGALALILGLAACSLPAEDARELTEGAPALIGGQLAADGTSWAVRTVSLRGKDDHESFCTGVIIAPDAVLTAAHCLLDEGLRKSSKDFEIVFNGDSRQTDRKQYRVRQAKRTLIHHGYLDIGDTCPFGDCQEGDDLLEYNPHDLALIQLDRLIPAPYLPVALNQLPLVHDSVAILAGYGTSVPLSSLDDEDEDEVKKHSGRLRVLTSRISLRFAEKNIVQTNKKILLVSTLTTGACHGDSGGPAFQIQNGIPTLIGISSHGSIVASEYPCGWQGTAYTDIASYRDWILKSLKKIRETSPVSGRPTGPK